MVSVETIDNMQTDGPALLEAAIYRLGQPLRTQRLIAILPVYDDDIGHLARVYVVTAPEVVPDGDPRKSTALDAIGVYLLHSGEFLNSLCLAQNAAAHAAADAAPLPKVVHHS